MLSNHGELRSQPRQLASRAHTLTSEPPAAQHSCCSKPTQRTGTIWLTPASALMANHWVWSDTELLDINDIIPFSHHSKRWVLLWTCRGIWWLAQGYIATRWWNRVFNPRVCFWLQSHLLSTLLTEGVKCDFRCSLRIQSSWRKVTTINIRPLWDEAYRWPPCYNSC